MRRFMDDELSRRQRRTAKYLDLWGVKPPAGETAPATIVAADAQLRTAHEVHRRLVAEALLGLVGEGLEQREAFAMADAFDIWAELDPQETDLVLDIERSAEASAAALLRFERAAALAWAVEALRHLQFSDQPTNTGEVVRIAVTDVANRPAELRPPLRPDKELLDRADIERTVAAVPGAHQRIAAERAEALSWLVGIGR